MQAAALCCRKNGEGLTIRRGCNKDLPAISLPASTTRCYRSSLYASWYMTETTPISVD